MALTTNAVANLNGWVVGYTVGAVVVVVIALLIVAIIRSVRRIRATADDITTSLVTSQKRTDVLWALSTSRSTADDIVGMAGDARAALGG
jgi:hypothetical protein